MFDRQFYIPLKSIQTDRCYRCRRDSGFTLLEVLIVVLLMGIILSFASLKLDSNEEERTLNREAYRVQALLELTKDEAILQSREYGIRFEPTGYQFYTWTPPKWHIISRQDEILRPREFPKHISATLELEGENFSLTSPEDNQSKQTEKLPQILILSSGEITPFLLQLRTQGASYYKIRGNLLGEIQIQRETSR